MMHIIKLIQLFRLCICQATNFTVPESRQKQTADPATNFGSRQIGSNFSGGAQHSEIQVYLLATTDSHPVRHFKSGTDLIMWRCHTLVASR